MTTRMHLVTFLANDSADSVACTSRLSKYGETPGGADYYWALKRGAGKIFLEETGFDEAVSLVMANMTVPHQRRDNQAALLEVYEWRRVRHGLAIAPPSGSIAGPRGELVIKLEPAFALSHKGINTAYVPWTFKDLRLNANVAGMGVHLLQLGLHTSHEAG